MTLALNILLILLGFPILSYIFLAHPFTMFPFLRTLLSTPISLDKISAQLGLSNDADSNLPDEFEDEERWKGFNPSFVQQIEARQALLHLLPFELCTAILRFASYHTLLSVTSTQRVSIMATSAAEQSRVYLRSNPLPRRGKLMQIRIAMRGRDQGFSGTPQLYGTYEGSSSYYQTCLLRSIFPPGAAISNGSANESHWQEVPASRRTIQYNVHAGQYVKCHSVAFDRQEELAADSDPYEGSTHYPLVDMAQPGDVIQLEISARWAAWANRVSGGRIDCYVAVYDDDA